MDRAKDNLFERIRLISDMIREDGDEDTMKEWAHVLDSIHDELGQYLSYESDEN